MVGHFRNHLKLCKLLTVAIQAPGGQHNQLDQTQDTQIDFKSLLTQMLEF